MCQALQATRSSPWPEVKIPQSGQIDCVTTLINLHAPEAKLPIFLRMVCYELTCNARDPPLRSSGNQPNIKDNGDYGVMVKLLYPVKKHNIHF